MGGPWVPHPSVLVLSPRKEETGDRVWEKAYLSSHTATDCQSQALQPQFDNPETHKIATHRFKIVLIHQVY